MRFAACFAVLCAIVPAGWGQVVQKPPAFLPTASVNLTAADSAGFLYLAGTIRAGDLPVTAGALQPLPPAACVPAASCTPTFLAKVSAADDSIVWATYFIGDGSDRVTALALTPAGELVIAGSTSSPGLLPIATKPGSLFLAKLSADGKRLSSSTYFGGTSADTAEALRLDAAGNIYVAGDAKSADFPTTPGAYQRTAVSGPPPAGYAACADPGTCSDQFVAKFDPTLSKLLFSTLAGGPVQEFTADLAIGPDGSLYLSGTRGPLAAQGPGQTRPLITRLSADASSLIYSSEIATTFPNGGPVVVDADGTAYIATYNRIRWPLTGADSLTWKVSPQGAVLASQAIHGIVTSMEIGPRGDVTFAGQAMDTLLPITAGAPRPCVSHNNFRPVAAYVARWNPASGAVTYSGFLNATLAWLAGPDRVIADSAFLGLPRFSLLPAGIPPGGTATCIANAAGYDNTALAPGEILSIFGVEIGPKGQFTTQLDAAGKVRTDLGGATVSIGGIPAPILFASPGQLNVVAPFGIPTSGNVAIEIRRDNVRTAAFAQAATPTHAAFFTTDGSRDGPIAALNQDGSVNSLSNPALAGSIVTAFATGLGVMRPAVQDGSVANGPVATPAVHFDIVVGASAAEVLYFGNAPSLVAGAIQINFRIPLTAAPRDGVLVVGISGGTNSVPLAVKAQ